MTDNRPVVPAVLGVPTDQEGPVFREPWEARVFAMAVALHETGIFAWSDWAGALGEEIAGAGAAGDSGIADSYYDHWLVALEKMAAQKGLADGSLRALYREAWSRAARRTAHGSPIELRVTDFKALSGGVWTAEETLRAIPPDGARHGPKKASSV
jgi:nitrile hydratase accessory protein